MNNQDLTNMILTEICGVYVCGKKAGEMSMMKNRQSIGLSFKLYRAFSQRFGISPSQYRKSAENDGK